MLTKARYPNLRHEFEKFMSRDSILFRRLSLFSVEIHPSCSILSSPVPRLQSRTFEVIPELVFNQRKTKEIEYRWLAQRVGDAVP